MQYFFVLGNNPTLSIAEISAILPHCNYSLPSNNFLIVETKEILDAKILIKKLGGTIKIGEIIHTTTNQNFETWKDKIYQNLNGKAGSKFKFGISYYGTKKFDLKRIAMSIKEYLKNVSINSRWVISQEPTLSSVVVEQNKLITSGIELVIVEDLDNQKLIIGKTLAVQAFKELSFRDYGRPARDNQSGMLPPKLAQILINLSQAGYNDLILDPFCGSGTVITESLLMGYQNIIGSDISEKAIHDTKRNIDWTALKFNKNISLDPNKIKLLKADAIHLASQFEPNSIDAIITEPYLGPQRGKIDIKKSILELEDLYSKSLAQFYQILKLKGNIAIVFPVFNLNDNQYFLNPNFNKLQIINILPETLSKDKFINLTKRGTIIYSRPDQRVLREIFILTKQF
ncbi:MAG: DNA methyltransferase [Candidatus Falkowbacteria bacterium]|nr:DNA methyltransferase [Candidatus Falkowbacteria bacterium]